MSIYVAKFPENLWFRRTFGERYRVKLDACFDPYIPCVWKSICVWAYDVGVLGIDTTTTRQAAAITRGFPNLHMIQQGDEEHTFTWEASHPDTNRLLERLRARKRRRLSDEQRQKLAKSNEPHRFRQSRC